MNESRPKPPIKTPDNAKEEAVALGRISTLITALKGAEYKYNEAFAEDTVPSGKELDNLLDGVNRSDANLIKALKEYPFKTLPNLPAVFKELADIIAENYNPPIN